MSTDRISPIVALRRHKRLGAVLLLVGIAAGLGIALSRPVVYTAEMRLAASGGSLSAEAVPGFALASQQIAANYARYVNDAEEQGALEAKLGVRSGTIDGVSASPIPESNVIRVEVTGRDATTTKRAVATVATSLIRKVEDAAGAWAATAAETLKQFSDMSNQVAAAQLAADAANAAVRAAQPGNLQELQQAAAKASTQLSILKVQQDALAQKYRNEVSSATNDAATLTVVEDAVVTGNDRLARLQQFGLAGAVIGALAALLLSVWRERRGPRPDGSREGVGPSPAAEALASGEAPAQTSTPAPAVAGRRAD